MPTILNKNGFKFFFYANEHEPKHIHVMKGEGFAKVEIDSFRVAIDRMKPKDLKAALDIIQEHNAEFKRSWNDYFSQR
jgi:hypothetical protein